MLTIRQAADRGATRIGWLNSWHTFSFGEYFDPEHHHFRSLRVINDDVVAPMSGFGTHPHRDMEIVTHVISGALSHRDSMGHGATLQAGDWQAMTAGTGITHSEYNDSPDTPVHLLQIWLLPGQKGLTPSYRDARFPEADYAGKWKLAVSPDGRDGSLAIHQDAFVNAATLQPGETLIYPFAAGRAGWLQVATGAVQINGVPLKTGDGVAIEQERQVEINGLETGRILLFDMK